MIERENTISRKGGWAWLAVLGVAIVAVVLIVHWTRQPERNIGAQSASVSSMKMDSSGGSAGMVSLTNEAMVRSGIGVVPVASRDFNTEVSAVGVLEIPEPAERTITARARGRIERMFVASTGAYVRKGEPLFEFYSPDILAAEKEYLIAAGAMDEASMVHTPAMQHHADPGLMKAGKRRLELFGMTSEQIRQLGDNGTVANTITVTAPMDGLVLQKLAQEGAYVDEGTSIFQLADLSNVWAEVDVPESNIRFIRMGQTVRIQTAAYPGEQFAGTVILISPVEDQTSRTIRVRLALPNPSFKLRPQMTFTTTLSLASGRTLAVPQSAVVKTGTVDYVWVLDSGTMFTRHEVTLGALSPDNYYQVVSGLASGDRVASQGAFLIDAEHELTKSNPMAGMNMGETGNKNSGEGTGVVRSIDMQRQAITLDHGTIPGIMPGMTMGYKVSDPQFLQSVKVNGSVRFTLTHGANGEYTITAIQQQ